MTKDEIINTICEVCGIQPGDILRETRVQDIAMARHLIAHYLHSRLHMPIRDIAREIGLKRSAVYFPLYTSSIMSRLPGDTVLRARFNELETIFKTDYYEKLGNQTDNDEP